MLYSSKDGLIFSKIALGSADFGTIVEKKDAFAIMDAYYENGGNFIDTARVYAEWRIGGKDASENTVGEWLKDRKLNGKVIISTKGAHPPISDSSVSRLNQKDIEDDLDKSLKYLNTDCIDLYFLHRDDKKKPVSEIMPILDGLVKSGKVRKIGASNWTAERIKEANDFARQNGLEEFSFSQIMFSYAKVNPDTLQDKTQVVMDDTEYAFYKSEKIPLMAYRSQAQGFYSKVASKGFENLSDGDKKTYVNKINRERFSALDLLSKQTGIPHAALGLIPLVTNRDIDISPIVGISKLQRLREVLSVVEIVEKCRQN